MFIQVLDLIVPGGRRPRHPRWENLEPVKDTVDSVQQPAVTDSIDTLQNGNAVTDTISNSSLEVMGNNLGTGAGNTPSVLLTLFFVIVALAICFYLIFAYRRHLASPRNR